MKIIEISKLIVLQGGLRHSISEYNPSHPFEPIKLTYLADLDGRPKYAIHDGLHRIISLYQHGVKILNSTQYICSLRTVREYNECNFNKGYVTPFDIYTEVRKANFGNFKDKVLQLHKMFGHASALNYIENNRELYVENRSVWTVEEFLEIYENAGKIGATQL